MCAACLRDLRTPTAYDRQAAEIQQALDQWEGYQRGVQQAFSSNDPAHLKMQMAVRKRGNETTAEQEMNKAWLEWKIRDAIEECKDGNNNAKTMKTLTMEVRLVGVSRWVLRARVAKWVMMFAGYLASGARKSRLGVPRERRNAASENQVW